MNNKLVEDPYHHDEDRYTTLKNHCTDLADLQMFWQKEVDKFYVAMRRINCIAASLGKSSDERCKQIYEISNKAVDDYTRNWKQRVKANKAQRESKDKQGS